MNVRLPLGVAVNEGIRCTEIYSTKHDGLLLGYAIDFSGKTDAYMRLADGSLLHYGSFARHDDAVDAVLREA